MSNTKHHIVDSADSNGIWKILEEIADPEVVFLLRAVTARIDAKPSGA